VPPNDAAVGDIRILPDRRRRQPRQFPAATLHGGVGEPHLRLIWQTDVAPDRLVALRALAQDTSYIGHSSSLVRCIFLDGLPEPKTDLVSVASTAAPYPGRLRELETLYVHHVATADSTARPRPAPLIRPQQVATPPISKTVFGERWIVFEFVDGDRPDLRATAVIGRRMRDALMSAWPDPIPEWLSGHTADGAPSREPHLAVVPLGNVGFPHSESARQPLLGLALVLPRAIEPEWTGSDTPEAFANSQTLQAVLDRLMRPSPTEATMGLRLGKLGEVRLRRVGMPEAAKHSLRPSRYIEERRLWSTATPIALDRHTKSGQPREETAAIIAESCTRIGLPRRVAVHVHKHAAIAGAPSAWPPGGAPHWTGWARPGSLETRQLTHATLRFAEKVAGPIILGAGRFFGLGLCLPVDERGRS
jgi:CRISPR-associated protein Csb2